MTFVEGRYFSIPGRTIAENLSHSTDEDRFYYIGGAGNGIMTVRFNVKITIFPKKSSTAFFKEQAKKQKPPTKK